MGRDDVGGFCGDIEGENATATDQPNISNCYSRASVTRTSGRSNTIGGFGGDVEKSIIKNCYSTGLVSGGTTNNLGGFIGSSKIGAAASTFENNFFDIETSHRSNPGHNVTTGVTGKTSAEMKNVDTFTDESLAGLTEAWDFETNPNDDDQNENIWDKDPGNMINNGYPFFSCSNGSDITPSVELSYFTVERNKSTVLVKWETASEINNMGFNIYRSELENGNFIKPNRSMIFGAGNSSWENEYLFVDDKITAGKTYYFQLEDISYDGTKEKHDIISITIDETEINNAAGFQLLPVYPNPTNPSAHIRFNIEKRANITLNI